MRPMAVTLLCGLVTLGVAVVGEARGQRDEVALRSFSTLMSRLSPGDQVKVRETSGDLVEGRFDFLNVEAGRLVITDAHQIPREGPVSLYARLELSKNEIQHILVEREHSRARSIAVGAGLGVGAAALAAQGCCGNPDVGPQTMFLYLAPVFAGAGGLVGYLTDSGFDESELVYTAEAPGASFCWYLSPLITGDRKGVVVRLSF